MDFKTVIKLYPGMSIMERLLARYAYHSSPLEKLERLVPKEGTIVDLGCGWGLFANLLCLASPARTVIGVDLSDGRIRAAEESVGDRQNIRYIHEDILRAELPASDAFLLIGVLYMLAYDDQRGMLEKCYGALNPGGILLLKPYTVRNSRAAARWKEAYASLHTYFFYSVINICKGILHLLPKRKIGVKAGGSLDKVVGSRKRRPFVWEEEDLIGTLRKIGFEVETLRIKPLSIVPHVVYICRKGKEHLVPG